MCFSATASFTAAAALLVVGVATVRQVKRRNELPLALVPLLFGLQQLLEGVLWLTFPDKAPLLNTVLTHAYSFFSHVLWPIYVPLAVLLIETTRWRRKALAGIALAGAGVGLYLSYFLVELPVEAVVIGQHIAYVSPHFYAAAAMGLYLVATCVSLLLSSHPMVRLFGAAATLSFAAAYAFYAFWFISVWCFFAAAMSGIVYLQLRQRKPEPGTTLPNAGPAPNVVSNDPD